MQQILVAVLLLISSATAFVAAPTRGLLSSPWYTTTSNAAAAAAAAAAEAVLEELPSVMDGVKGAKLEVIDEVRLAAADYPAQTIAETASVSAVSCNAFEQSRHALTKSCTYCFCCAGCWHLSVQF
jgi:hypothetical protein